MKGWDWMNCWNQKALQTSVFKFCKGHKSKPQIVKGRLYNEKHQVTKDMYDGALTLLSSKKVSTDIKMFCWGIFLLFSRASLVLIYFEFSSLIFHWFMLGTLSLTKRLNCVTDEFTLLHYKLVYFFTQLEIFIYDSQI